MQYHSVAWAGIEPGSYCPNHPELQSCATTPSGLVVCCFFFPLCTCGVWVHMHVWCVGTCECGCTCMWKLKLILGVILNHLFIEVGSLKQNSQIWLVLLASLFRLHLPRLELQMGWLTYTAFLCGFLGIWTFLYGKCFNCWAIFRSIFGFSGFF